MDRREWLREKERLEARIDTLEGQLHAFLASDAIVHGGAVTDYGEAPRLQTDARAALTKMRMIAARRKVALRAARKRAQEAERAAMEVEAIVLGVRARLDADPQEDTLDAVQWIGGDLAAERAAHEQTRARLAEAEERIYATDPADLAGFAAREAQAPTVEPSREEPEAIAALRAWCDSFDGAAGVGPDGIIWAISGPRSGAKEEEENRGRALCALRRHLDAAPEVLRLYDEARDELRTACADRDALKARLAEVEAERLRAMQSHVEGQRAATERERSRSAQIAAAHGADVVAHEIAHPPKLALEACSVPEVRLPDPAVAYSVLKQRSAEIKGGPAPDAQAPSGKPVWTECRQDGDGHCGIHEEGTPGCESSPTPTPEPTEEPEAPSIDPGEGWRPTATGERCPSGCTEIYDAGVCEGPEMQPACWECGSEMEYEDEPDPVHAPTGDLPPVAPEAAEEAELVRIVERVAAGVYRRAESRHLYPNTKREYVVLWKDDCDLADYLEADKAIGSFCAERGDIVAVGTRRGKAEVGDRRVWPRVEDAAPEAQAETMRPWRGEPEVVEDEKGRWFIRK